MSDPEEDQKVNRQIERLADERDMARRERDEAKRLHRALTATKDAYIVQKKRAIRRLNKSKRLQSERIRERDKARAQRDELRKALKAVACTMNRLLPESEDKAAVLADLAKISANTED